MSPILNPKRVLMHVQKLLDQAQFALTDGDTTPQEYLAALTEVVSLLQRYVLEAKPSIVPGAPDLLVEAPAAPVDSPEQAQAEAGAP